MIPLEKWFFTSRWTEDPPSFVKHFVKLTFPCQRDLEKVRVDQWDLKAPIDVDTEDIWLIRNLKTFRQFN